VSRYLHTLSAALFYLVAGSFFLAYVLLRNDIGGGMPEMWLRIGDLPLLALGLLYGGLSIYRSLTDKPSRTLGIAIGLPLTLLFLLGCVANFWSNVPGLS
jgi:hypothetical protein